MNVLIQFFLSSTCFEYLVFIIRKTVLYMLPYMFSIHLCKQPTTLKDVFELV